MSGKRKLCSCFTTERWTVAIGWISLLWSYWNVFFSSIRDYRISFDQFLLCWNKVYRTGRDVSLVDLQRAWLFVHFLTLKWLNLTLALTNICMCILLIKGTTQGNPGYINTWIIYSCIQSVYILIVLVVACIIVTPLFGWHVIVPVTITVPILSALAIWIVSLRKKELESAMLESAIPEMGKIETDV